MIQMLNRNMYNIQQYASMRVHIENIIEYKSLIFTFMKHHFSLYNNVCIDFVILLFILFFITFTNLFHSNYNKNYGVKIF